MGKVEVNGVVCLKGGGWVSGAVFGYCMSNFFEMVVLEPPPQVPGG